MEDRPTSKELLRSIPPIVEEEKQEEMFKHVLEHPHSKLYRVLMECCFNQNDKYDRDMFSYDENNYGLRNVLNFNFVETVIKVSLQYSTFPCH